MHGPGPLILRLSLWGVEPSEQPGLLEGEAGGRGAAGENIPRRIAPKEAEEGGAGEGELAQKLAGPGLPGVQGDITGLGYRLPLRDGEAGAYGKILAARSKAPAEEIRYAFSEKVSETLRLHQKDAAALTTASMEKYGGFILARGTGVGKTVEEPAVAHLLACKRRVDCLAQQEHSQRRFSKTPEGLGLHFNAEWDPQFFSEARISR